MIDNKTRADKVLDYLAANPDRPVSYSRLAGAIGTQPHDAGDVIRQLLRRGRLEIVQQLRIGTIYRIPNVGEGEVS